jgi:hypothetical protein
MIFTTRLAADREGSWRRGALRGDWRRYSAPMLPAIPRLIGSDDEGTLVLLKSDRRELIDPLIAQHRGRIFKTTGDGMLRHAKRSRRRSP